MVEHQLVEHRVPPYQASPCKGAPSMCCSTSTARVWHLHCQNSQPSVHSVVVLWCRHGHALVSTHSCRIASALPCAILRHRFILRLMFSTDSPSPLHSVAFVWLLLPPCSLVPQFGSTLRPSAVLWWNHGTQTTDYHLKNTHLRLESGSRHARVRVRRPHVRNSASRCHQSPDSRCWLGCPSRSPD